jgi:ParB family chromosome partitioning protein
MDPDFETLKAAILAYGQQVPILVRPRVNPPKQYQAAYGHRRLRAVRELNIPIRAIVRPLSDVELVIAQGQENSERRDLTFIERALFASNLNSSKFDRDTITAALAVDKPELSRLLSVVDYVGTKIIMAIGAAPKAGRPRWLALSEKMSDSNAKNAALGMINSDQFRNASSDDRFNLLLNKLQCGQRNSSGSRVQLTMSNGRQVAWLERKRKSILFGSEEKAFSLFLEQRIPGLIREFESKQKTTDEPSKVNAENEIGEH